MPKLNGRVSIVQDPSGLPLGAAASNPRGNCASAPGRSADQQRPAPAARPSASAPASLRSLHARHHAGIGHRRCLVRHANRRPARATAPAGNAGMIAGRQILEIELAARVQRRTELGGANGHRQRAVFRRLAADVETAGQRADDAWLRRPRRRRRDTGPRCPAISHPASFQPADRPARSRSGSTGTNAGRGRTAIRAVPCVPDS